MPNHDVPPDVSCFGYTTVPDSRLFLTRGFALLEHFLRRCGRPVRRGGGPALRSDVQRPLRPQQPAQLNQQFVTHFRVILQQEPEVEIVEGERLQRGLGDDGR